MKHARADYNRIQDPLNLIPENEPVFLFRAQDKFAIEALEAYAQKIEYEIGFENQYYPGQNSEFVAKLVIISGATRRQIEEFKNWEKKKSPDIPTQEEYEKIHDETIAEMAVLHFSSIDPQQE